MTSCSKSTPILTCCKFSLEPKLILVNYSFLVIIHPIMRRFWTLIQTSILSISISLTLVWKNVLGKCSWKVSRGIVILINHTSAGLTGITNKTSDSNTCLTSSITYSTKFKPAYVINLISWPNQIYAKIIIIPIENSFSFVANIKSSFSSNILEWKS